MLARNKTDALMVAPDMFFASRNVQIVTPATRHAIPQSIPCARMWSTEAS